MRLISHCIFFMISTYRISTKTGQKMTTIPPTTTNYYLGKLFPKKFTLLAVQVHTYSIINLDFTQTILQVEKMLRNTETDYKL